MPPHGLAQNSRTAEAEPEPAIFFVDQNSQPSLLGHLEPEAIIKTAGRAVLLPMSATPQPALRSEGARRRKRAIGSGLLQSGASSIRFHIEDVLGNDVQHDFRGSSFDRGNALERSHSRANMPSSPSPHARPSKPVTDIISSYRRFFSSVPKYLRSADRGPISFPAAASSLSRAMVSSKLRRSISARAMSSAQSGVAHAARSRRSRDDPRRARRA